MNVHDFDLDLPSGRARYALAALDAFEATPGCLVDMTVFHGSQGGYTVACLGGAAALYRYQVPRAEWSAHRPSNFALWKELIAFEEGLDSLQKGNVSDYFRDMGLSAGSGCKFDRAITDRKTDSEQWRQDVLRLIEDLEREGW